MTTNALSLAHLSNDSIIAEVTRLAGEECRATARLVATLAVFDARRLYLGLGCSSLYTYCTTVLHLSEHAVYSRIEAARAGRRFPLILDLLMAGEVTVTNAGLLARVLTPENHQRVLAEAVHQSKRQVEELVARIRPRPEAPAVVRKLPVPRASEAVVPSCASPSAHPVTPAVVPLPGSSDAPLPVPVAPPRRPVVAPLAVERYKVQFTVTREIHDKLRRAQDLMRHTVPTGDLAAVFDRALTALLSELERQKFAAASRTVAPRPSASGSRHIPAAVKRAVWTRDAGQCAFTGTRGRCAETGFLEFHHVRPFAAGGEAEEGNIELRCRAHNQYEAELFFGPERMTARPGFGTVGGQDDAPVATRS